MVEEDRPHLLGGLEERKEFGLVPLLAVHLRVERRSLQPKLRHRALQLADRGLHVLYGQRGEPCEAPGVLADRRADLVVHFARQGKSLRRFEVIADERYVDGEHLHVHFLRVHVLQAFLHRVAHLGRTEARAHAASHHRAQALARLVTKAMPFLFRVDGLPQRFRDDVGMDVYRFHEFFVSR